VLRGTEPSSIIGLSIDTRMRRSELVERERPKRGTYVVTLRYALSLSTRRKGLDYI
jgi:hypothetical protein